MASSLNNPSESNHWFLPGFGMPRLHWALMNRCDDEAWNLLNEGADPFIVDLLPFDKCGCFLLKIYSDFFLSAAKVIFQCVVVHAAVSWCFFAGVTALHLACQGKRSEIRTRIVRFILERAPSANFIDAQNATGRTALFHAIYFNNVQVTGPV